jgi:CBS domain-containing membrane protein
MRSLHTLGLSAQQWCLRLVPNTIKTSPKEQLRTVVGAALGLFVTALVSQYARNNLSPWFVAPIGASAVLVFTTPSGPLAQPWALVGGNTLSALVGIACATYVTPAPLAAALAVALAMATMFVFRCIHPPGGAMALLVVLTHETTLSFVAFPVLTNSVLLAIFGMLYNSGTGHPYPHHQALSDPAHDAWADSSRFTKADLDTALTHYNEVLDVNPDDLIGLLRHAEAAAYQRTLGELRCQDIMTADPIAVQFGTSLQEAWALMRQFHIKALPIVDQAKHVVGIVTVADFLRHAGIHTPHDLTKRMQTLLRPSGLSHSERPEVVGQIMTRKVRVTSAQGHAVDLLPLFSAVGHHHLPVINAEKKLIGILTQTDLVKALSRSVQR